MSRGYHTHSNIFDAIHNFVVAGAHNELTEEDWSGFEQLLLDDRDARRLYFQYVAETSLLQTVFDAMPDDDSASSDTVRVASQCPTPPLHIVPVGLWSGTFTYLSSDWPVAYFIATVIFGIGAIIGSTILVSQPGQVALESPPAANDRMTAAPTTQPVGLITGMVDCRWAGTDRVSRDVALGSTYRLASGLLEITYTTGSKVILKGPVTYTVESTNGGFLRVGKLTSKVEGVAAKGFVVRTPVAIVTDLGTEFGVAVDEKGGTMSHVFRGAIRVERTGSSGGPESDGQVLRQDQSVRVERRDGQSQFVNVASAVGAGFVRDLPKDIEERRAKTFDLVDVVAGGDGFGHARGRGIHPNTGEIANGGPPDGYGWEQDLSDADYHRVPDLPFVDGVFVPDDRRGPVQLDSAGHTFGGFGIADARIFNPIWAGIPIPQPLPPRIRTELGGTEYGSPGHGSLSMVPNKGITFDLDAIRRANPGCRIVRFRAMAGNTEPTLEYKNYVSEGIDVFADIFVFVDGKNRFERRRINSSHGGMPINIALADSDRFLTLVAADGGDGIGYDWVMFGDPRLELLSGLVREEKERQ